ncbi:MAG: acylase [Congregibacter sp.]
MRRKTQILSVAAALFFINLPGTALAQNAVLAAPIAEESAGAPSSTPTYTAKLRRGPYGVAHIQADDYGSLGYGEAFAAAEDHVCNIAYELLRAKGELARYFGPGAQNAHIASDAVIGALDITGQAERAYLQQSQTIRDRLAGYSAGFNRYLKEHSGTRNGSWCAGADWLSETTPQDFMTRMVAIALTLPRISGAIAAAQPPASVDKADAPASMAKLTPRADGLDGASLIGLGSNGWALGADKTENGRGLLLGNPHYPWYGGNRFWEKHLTIPGELDVYGAGLLGTPGVLIGFNEGVAWTHTVSASQRLVMYQLTLDPENPLRYRYGDGWKEIEKREVDVAVRAADGQTVTRTQPVYFSHYGPMLVMPNMGWSEQAAFTARDANTGNVNTLAQWLAMDQATDMNSFIEAHREYGAMPWVNTISTSVDGRAVYIDNTNVGKLSDAAQEHWSESLQSNPLAAGLYAQRRMILLDGSEPDNEWLVDPQAILAGTTPFEERPLLERSDYVFNANDSYWLSNPHAPLRDYSVLYGPTKSARSLRTRMNVRLLENHYGDAGKDGRFNIHEVQRALFANRGLTAELLLEPLIAACDAAEDELQNACDVLRAYDGTLNLDAPGAVLFREWITRFEWGETTAAGKLFAEDFDLANPVDTPRGLGDSDAAISALRGAIAVLEAAGLKLDASLRDTQFAYRAGRAIPIHGGISREGVANLQMPGNPSASPISGIKPVEVADSRFLTDKGYPVVHGSSFILTMNFTNKGPVAEALLSYSQSGAPGTAHFTDQTELYAAKKWRRIAFREADVKRHTRSIRMLRSADESLTPK